MLGAGDGEIEERTGLADSYFNLIIGGSGVDGREYVGDVEGLDA